MKSFEEQEQRSKSSSEITIVGALTWLPALLAWFIGATVRRLVNDYPVTAPLAAIVFLSSWFVALVPHEDLDEWLTANGLGPCRSRAKWAKKRNQTLGPPLSRRPGFLSEE